MSTDPDIQAAWDKAEHALTALLRPYVQAHLVEDLARRFVAEHLAAEGWRPPLGRLPEVIRTGRLRALDRPPEQPPRASQ